MIRSNLWKLRCIAVFRWFLLVLPILVLFYQSRGLSYFQIFLIQAFFSLAILVLEVPTGYIGDRFGWKLSIIIGGLLAVLGMLLFIGAQHFWWFLLAEVVLGISYCFFSGSDSALLYETLLDLNLQKQYQSEEGTLMAYAYVSEGVAAVIGGVLAVFSLRMPFYVELCVFIVLVPMTLSLRRPSNERLLVKQNPDVKARRQLRLDFYRVFEFINHSHFIKWTIICSGFMGFLSLASIWLMQVYFKHTGLPIYFMGVIWAILNLSRSLTAGWVDYFDYRIGTLNIFLMVPLVISVVALLMGMFVTSGVMLLGVLIQAARGMQLPIVYALINNRTTSDMRAAVLSFEGMVMRLFYVVCGPIIGLLCDYKSIHVAFYGIAAMAFFLGLIFYSQFYRYYPSFSVDAG